MGATHVPCTLYLAKPQAKFKLLKITHPARTSPPNFGDRTIWPHQPTWWGHVCACYLRMENCDPWGLKPHRAHPSTYTRSVTHDPAKIKSIKLSQTQMINIPIIQISISYESKQCRYDSYTLRNMKGGQAFLINLENNKILNLDSKVH